VTVSSRVTFVILNPPIERVEGRRLVLRRCFRGGHCRQRAYRRFGGRPLMDTLLSDPARAKASETT